MEKQNGGCCGHRCGAGRALGRLPPAAPGPRACRCRGTARMPCSTPRRARAVPGGTAGRACVMATVNGISDLPGIAKPDVDPAEPSSEFLSRYFAGYERDLGLAIRRPGQGHLRQPGRRRSRRPAAASATSDGGLVREGGHQRHRHLDQAVLAHLPGPAPPSGAGSCTWPITSPPRSSAACTSSWWAAGFPPSASWTKSRRSPPPAGSPAGNPNGGTPRSTPRPGTTPSPSWRNGYGRACRRRAWWP